MAKPLPSPSVDFALEVKSAGETFIIESDTACDDEEILKESGEKGVGIVPVDTGIEAMRQRGTEALRALMGVNATSGCGKCGCYDIRESVSFGKQVRVCRNCGYIR